MKAKAFTLIELLAVLIILAILAGIAIPLINKTIHDSKEKLYQVQLENIIKGAQAWALDNVGALPTIDKEQKKITLGTLKDAGYIDLDIENPKTQKPFANTIEIVITYDASIKGYRYQVNV